MKNFSKNFSVFILILISAFPIYRWSVILHISQRFYDFDSTMTSLGQVSGLLGMILFSVNLILSNRTKFFDRIFSGLNDFYHIHKWLGALSFSLLLFHPLFLALKFINISLYDTALFLLPSESISVNLGIFALLGMIILLGITFYLKIKYNIWKSTHKFMVFVFIFAIGHTMLISSDVSRDIVLRYYILFFSLFGLLSGVYRSFFRFLFHKDFDFKVKKINQLNENVIEIELEPIGKILKFSAGQFIFIRFIGVGISSESHPFSISSAASDSNIKLVIKSLGDFTRTLSSVQVGMIAKAEGPYGNFFKKNNTEKEIWIAGGVGITPFLSKARSLENQNYDVDLYYCLKDSNEAVLLEDLIKISKSNKRFKIFTWYSNTDGYINSISIKRKSGSLYNTNIYICGPLSFMHSLKDQFIKEGVAKNSINFEEFNFL